MKRATVVLSVLLCLILGCSESPKENKAVFTEEIQAINKSNQSISQNKSNENLFQPFFIYDDKGSRSNHYVPSGFMPNGRCISFVDSWQEKCYEGKTCIKIVYDIPCSRNDQKWVGIYWLNPPNNWGNRKGGFDLTGATKLTFWAKGESGGEQIEEFRLGGITGDYPDSDTAVIGPVILTNEWRQYTMDLRGKDLSYISGGFSWSTNVDVNPDGCTLFLDRIVYE